jgi:ketosteroid isomerase-like protein
MSEPEEIVLRAFEAVNTRDPELFARIVHPDATFVFPPALESRRFKTFGGRQAASYEDVWEPFQPLSLFATRRMDPKILASSGNRVVVLWRQRGINAAQEQLNVEVLGVYEVLDGRLHRAQMFYFDTDATEAFLRSEPYTS